MPREILIIAEKGIQGRQLANALIDDATTHAVSKFAVEGWMHGSDKIVIAWANGHLIEIAIPEKHDNKWSDWSRLELLPVRPAWLNFIREPRDESHLGAITSLVRQRKWTEVVNACDAGREGELIFDEIIEAAGWKIGIDKLPWKLSRMWLAATTPAAITAAWSGRENALSRRYADLRDAARARAEGDWLYGTNLSRYVTLAMRRSRPPDTKIQTAASIGRVKTPTLGMIFERCREIREFKEEKFWHVAGNFLGDGGSFQAKVVAFKEMRFGHTDTQFTTLGHADAIRSKMIINAAVPWTVMDEVTPSQQYPHSPFKLVDLQRCANRLWGWSASHTLAIAQRLYEHEHAISYPRTESDALPEEMMEEVQQTWRTLWNWAKSAYPKVADLPPPSFDDERHFDDKRVGDHFAIIPLGPIPAVVTPTDEYRTRDEYKLWELIAVRFLLAWLPPAQIARAKRFLTQHYDADRKLRAILECEPVTDPGWLVYEDALLNTTGIGLPLHKRLAEKAYPPCEGKAKLELVKIWEGKTSPPHYFTDDTILGAMELAGLGTAATRAEILSDLQRNYIFSMPRGGLVTTPEGNELVSVLLANKGEGCLDIAQSGEWEKMLGRIEKQGANKPTKEIFLNNILQRAKEIGENICNLDTGNRMVFDPDTGLPVTVSADGKQFVFPEKSRLRGARAPTMILKRKMSASDYVASFNAGAKGGGPFTDFIGKTGPFPAWLLWVAKEKKFEFMFKQRSNVPRGANTAKKRRAFNK